MKAIEFFYKDSCLVSETELKKIGQHLTPEIKRIQKALTHGYDTDYASLNLPTDIQQLNAIHAIVSEKRSLSPKALFVIGIGGSNLGAKAVHEAVHGILYNEQSPEIKIYWADTVDADYMHDMLQCMEALLRQGHAVLINVVSKSGTTTETIANFQLFLSILKKYQVDDWQRYVVITTDRESKLWKLGQQEKFVCLEVPKNVGGRYSVFSPVGLFPLSMLGVNIESLLEGARSIMPENTDEAIFANPAALSAAILAFQYDAGKNIHDTFLFSVELESIGKWYRQLMGESIGKEYTRTGKKINVGITPTVSIGSTDLHSVGQLYLGGPKDKCTTFVTVKSCSIDMSVPYMQGYEDLVAHIQDKSLTQLMHAIVTGVQRAYKKHTLPYVSFEFPEKSPFYLGQFLQCKMLEIMYLGYLLEVNPFDQPNVELYKQETREILTHE